MADIKFKFISDGVQSVRDDFKSVKGDAVDLSKAVEQGMRTIRSSSRVATQETARNARVEAERSKVVESAIDIRRQQAQELAKSVAADQSVQAKLTKVQQRENEQRQKQAQRDVAAREKLQQKDRDNERRHGERLAQIKRSAVDRESRDKAKDASIEQKRAFDKSFREKQYEQAIKKKRESIADGRSDSIKSSVRGAFIGGSAAVVAGTLGVAGAAARQSLALHEIANRVSINARGAGEEAVDPRILRKEFEATAAKTPGVGAADIGNAVQQFVTKTGNLDVARKSQGVFATVASATGSNISDVSEAAADLFQKFDITSIDGMADALSALAFQGKQGSFELKDAASQFARLSSAASRFGLGKGVESVKVLGGLTQIAREGTGSPEQAATAIESLFSQFTSAEAGTSLKKIGVNPFKDKGKTQTKEIRGLIVETISKAGGNQEILNKIFGKEGIRGVSKIISAFNDAKQTASVGGASMKDSDQAGADAAKSYIDKMIDAPGDYSELQRDAAQAQQDASAKVTAAWEKIVAGISDGAVPAIQSLVNTIENSPGAIDALIGTIENLLWYFGALVEASQAVLEFFKIVSKKTVSPEEKQAEARKKAEIAKSNLERFDKKRGGSYEQVAALKSEAVELKKAGKTKEAAVKEKEAATMATKLLATVDQDDERSRLVAKFGVAQNEVGKANGATATARDEKFRIRTAEQFATEYASKLDMDPERAKEVSRNVAARMQSFGSLEAMSGESIDVAGETEAAKSFRMSQAQERSFSAQNQTYGQEKTGDNMAAAMTRVEAAAKAMEAAAAAMKKGDQASIVPAP